MSKMEVEDPEMSPHLPPPFPNAKRTPTVSCQCCGLRLTASEAQEAARAERGFDWDDLHISFAGKRKK